MAKPSGMKFVTDTGIEVPAVTADQMREIDRIATEETGPNLFQMMENAGRNLATLAIELLGERWSIANVLVLAGTGGNGGGAICAARHLANRRANVRLRISEPDRLAPVAACQREVFQTAEGVEVDSKELFDHPDLILDGLIGYGLSAAPRAVVADLIGWANESGSPILSLDLPSGVDATTGETPGAFIRPQWTMTLALPKAGLFAAGSGELFLCDIGIPGGVFRRLGLNYKPPFGSRYCVPLSVARS